jgi:hypothetical protein
VDEEAVGDDGVGERARARFLSSKMPSKSIQKVMAFFPLRRGILPPPEVGSDILALIRQDQIRIAVWQGPITFCRFDFLSK